ncbi:GNAT family N-acetyltransferase [Falsigemmobacter intermedius]|uniref:GNAT family N-acetyltransferase n=1 Tax=Falsigemmobacter intermedius TaxID=1553448 RepID=UPI003F09E015
MEIRPENRSESDQISALITAAFETAPHRDSTEAAIVQRLREAGGLSLSLVAHDGAEILGHIAFSPVTITAEPGGWYGLAPLSVRPDMQGQGVGAALLREGLSLLRSRSAAGVVVLGDPGYYGRFGFASHTHLTFIGPPPEYFQVLSFGDSVPSGEVAYHPAFFG